MRFTVPRLLITAAGSATRRETAFFPSLIRQLDSSLDGFSTQQIALVYRIGGRGETGARRYPWTPSGASSQFTSPSPGVSRFERQCRQVRKTSPQRERYSSYSSETRATRNPVRLSRISVGSLWRYAARQYLPKSNQLPPRMGRRLIAAPTAGMDGLTPPTNCSE